MGNQILFVTDGSRSADKAGAMAIKIATLQRINLKTMYILDEGWGSLLGDEWINTSATRMNFFHWFEGELRKQAEQILSTFTNRAAVDGIPVQTEIVTGKTIEVITNHANDLKTNMLVLPNPNSTKPAAAAGLKFNIHHLAKKVKCPILLGPQ